MENSTNYRVTCEPVRASAPARVIKFDIHILNLEQCDEYIGAIGNDIIDDGYGKHAVFTPDRIVPAVQHLIENKQFTIVKDDDCRVLIKFCVEIPFAGQSISDSLTIACTLAQQCEDARRVRMLERELEKMRDRLMTALTLARDAAIRGMIIDTEHRFGPIPWFQYDFALKIFAAEFDGVPYIFPVIDLHGPIIAPWVRCVIRIVRIGPMLLSHWIPQLRCKRLICETMPANEDWNQRCGLCKGHHSPSNPYSRCEKMPTNEQLMPKIYSLHPDVRDLFITVATEPLPGSSRDDGIRRGSQFVIVSEKMQTEHKVNVLIDEQIRPPALNDAFIHARIIGMKGRDLRQFETETLSVDLAAAQERTKGIKIPLCESDYWNR